MTEELPLAVAGRVSGHASGRVTAAETRGPSARQRALALVLLFVLFPIVWLAQMSLRPDEDILGYRLLFDADSGALQSLVESKFLHSFLNSIVASCVSTAVALVVGTPAAYVLSRWRFRARRKIAMWILSTRMAPQITFTIPVLPLLSARRPQRHGLGPRADLPDVQPGTRHLDDADRSSMRFRGRSRKRRGSMAAASGAPFCASPCRSRPRGSPPSRCCASSSRGTTSSMH